MNQLWVRISLTYVAIVVFLFLIPTIVLVTFNADYQPPTLDDPEGIDNKLDPRQVSIPIILERVLSLGKIQIIGSLMRILLSVSLVGMLVGVISSRGLTAPLNNLAKAARAVGSQDLSQRIEVKGSSEIQEVAIAFNAMAEALEQADNLRNNMLADIAHELRTPLTVIQGNLRAILDDVYELDKVEVARLYDQTRQLSRLVDDLHDLALLEAKEFSLNLSTQSLFEIIQDVAAIYQPIFDDQGVTLSLELNESISEVKVDCARITQCVNNLVNNALRHTDKGGKVIIALSERDQAVFIRVIDNGVGVDPEHLPHIFDRFYRVDADRNRRTGGSGLGLAITQALVQAHGGEISVFSRGQNLGSEFVIQLPVTS
jgi:signal transduction histidine kinase